MIDNIELLATLERVFVEASSRLGIRLQYHLNDQAGNTSFTIVKSVQNTGCIVTINIDVSNGDLEEYELCLEIGFALTLMRCAFTLFIDNKMFEHCVSAYIIESAKGNDNIEDIVSLAKPYNLPLDTLRDTLIRVRNHSMYPAVFNCLKL